MPWGGVSTGRQNARDSESSGGGRREGKQAHRQAGGHGRSGRRSRSNKHADKRECGRRERRRVEEEEERPLLVKTRTHHSLSGGE